MILPSECCPPEGTLQTNISDLASETKISEGEHSSSWDGQGSGLLMGARTAGSENAPVITQARGARPLKIRCPLSKACVKRNEKGPCA